MVAAGCSAPAADPGPTRTLMPAATATRVSPLPPGVLGESVTDVDALVAAHAAAIEERSFTVRIRTSYDDLSGFRVLRVESARRGSPADGGPTLLGTGSG